MKQLGTPGGSGFITGLRAKVTVLNATAQECTSNTIAASQASAQLIGSFFDGDFNDGGSATILGVFQLQKDSDGGNRIVAALLQCPVVFCFLFPPTPIALPGNPAVFSMAWSLDTPLILKFVWDEVNGKFTFAVTDPATLGTESRDIVYLGTVTNARPPSLHFKNVRVSNTVENCSTGRKAALMDALFDNVKVMRQP